MNNEELTTRFADVSCLSGEDYEKMAELSRMAFGEYKKDSDLNLRGVTMNGDYVRHQAEYGTRFVMIYQQEKLIAYGGSRMMKDAQGHRYMYGEGLAIHPEYRRLRLGWRVARLKEDWGREQGAEYFELTTAAKALQAIRFHRRNQYQIWNYTHFSTTNYYSVVMRKDVSMGWTEWKRRKALVKSWVRTKLSWDEAGNPRRVGRALRHLGGCVLRTLGIR